jgi:hypothetical protein
MFEGILKRLPWSSGRQDGGYKKLRLFQSKLLLCDCYLLYYPQGSRIGVHTDEVSFGRHYRLNIMLKKAKKGGEFVCPEATFTWWRFALFRPDIQEHMVKTIQEGYRVMLSIGWVRK